MCVWGYEIEIEWNINFLLTLFIVIDIDAYTLNSLCNTAAAIPKKREMKFFKLNIKVISWIFYLQFCCSVHEEKKNSNFLSTMRGEWEGLKASQAIHFRTYFYITKARNFHKNSISWSPLFIFPIHSQYLRVE